jgi:hypothetical protein
MSMYIFPFLFAIIVTFSSCSSHNTTTVSKATSSIDKVEMKLSAFGVESDKFPSIAVYLDFVKDSSHCAKSYYNPSFKNSSYTLSGSEMKKVLDLLQKCDLEKLKPEYTISKSDQPTSVLTVYTNTKTFTVKDYGLEGEYPLKELYSIVYKF